MSRELARRTAEALAAEFKAGKHPTINIDIVRARLRADPGYAAEAHRVDALEEDTLRILLNKIV